MPAAAHHCVGHSGSARVGTHVVHAHDVGPARDAERCRRQRALEALVGREVEHLADGRLAARAQQDRPAESAQRVELAQQQQVVFGRLAEADTGVDDEAVALDAGANLLNDIWAVGLTDELARLAAERGVPIVLMHNRREARYRNVLAEVIADLSRAIERALAAGVEWENTIVDPGIGFGKTAEHNLALLRELPALSVLGRPILLGTSRKSTIGKVLDLPAGQRLEGTLATTALGIAGGADIVRVHDLEANRRVVRMSDAIVRGGWSEAAEDGP